MEFVDSGSNSNSELLSDCESAESHASDQLADENEDKKLSLTNFKTNWVEKKLYPALFPEELMNWKEFVGMKLN